MKKVLTLLAFSKNFALAATAPHPASLQLAPASITEGLGFLRPPNLTLSTPPVYHKASAFKLWLALTHHSTVHDPYDLHVEGSSLTIEFYGYGPPLTFAAVTSCCLKAFIDCKAHGGLGVPGEDELMGTAVRVYSYRDTHLYLYPGESMTWGLLNHFQMGMRQFQLSRLNTPRQTSFILLEDEEEGDVGHGTISR